MKSGIHVDGIMPCPGIETCLYQHCVDAGAPPSSPGYPCSFEIAYANTHEVSFRSQWSYVADARCADFEALVTESTTIALQRLRIAARANAAWALTDGKGGLAPKAHKEIELTTRYAITLGNRWLTLQEKLSYAAEEVRAQLEDRYWRQKALTSPIGSTQIPEPYRSWSVEVMARHRKAAAPTRTRTG